MRTFVICKKPRLAASVLLALFAVAACSGGDRSGSSTPTAATPVPTSSTEAAAGATAAVVAGEAAVRNTPQDVTFPPRNEPFAFRSGILEPKYRDQLRRPIQNSFVDIEGTIVWTQEYLRYRVNGCSHLDAVSRVFSQIEGRGISPVCATVTGDPIFPPRNEPFDFRQRLEAKYRDELRRAASQTAVDIEGDIVWTQEYLRYRVSGCSHQEAIDKVVAQIDGRGVQPACTATPEPPTVPPTNPQCTYALIPNANNNIGESGGTFSVNVSVQPGCTWRVTSTVPWASVNVTGSGSSPVSYTVAANTGAGRSGRLALLDSSGAEVASQAISQQGTTAPPVTPCSYSVSPTTQNVISVGGPIQISVTPIGTNLCAWTATPQASFLTITSGGSGTGAGTVRVEVGANTATTARSGVLRIAWSGGSQDVTVSQGGTPPLVASFTVSPDPCPIIDNPSNPGGSSVAHCTFDASSSSSGANITSYDWTGVFTRNGRVLAADSVNVGCGFGSGTFVRSLTLTVRDALGRVASVTRDVSFRKDSGC